ncbi:MAG: TetR family transcriptional regulator [Gemmatimonadetes bacterium]|nr:TetR family transcriptional regulator [Gemmatimonadota bacterium]
MARVAGRSLTKAQVAEAAWRVILRDGLHQASIRAIAAELGATTGVVTYHFRDKAELLLFALDRLGAAILRDMDLALAQARGTDRLRAILRATLPHGQRQASGWRLWLSFVGLAMSDRRLREEHQKRLELLNSRFEAEIRSLQAAGLVDSRLDARQEADGLVALSDGIGLSHVLRPKVYHAERQWAIVSGYLASRLGIQTPRAARR